MLSSLPRRSEEAGPLSASMGDVAMSSCCGSRTSATLHCRKPWRQNQIGDTGQELWLGPERDSRILFLSNCSCVFSTGEKGCSISEPPIRCINLEINDGKDPSGKNETEFPGQPRTSRPWSRGVWSPRTWRRGRGNANAFPLSPQSSSTELVTFD
jgi:hypothetical protein